jgi:predicted transcriptional regulator
LKDFKEIIKLTNREADILRILWSADHPLIASEIANAEDTLTINTVQVVLKNLLRKKLIEIADIVYSGTVLSRSYRPTITAKDLTVQQFVNDVQSLSNVISTPKLVATLLEHEENEEEVIVQLEKILHERKKQLKDGGN